MTTRLTALDDAFLAFETARTPAHVGSVAFFEGAPFHDERRAFRLAEIRARVESRLHLVPRLRQIPVSTPLGVGQPLLVDDPAFDIAHHIKLLQVGAPADETAVFALAAELHMERLDRAHPLWELWFVDGLADGRVALVEKIHHSIVDGVSGVEVATVLLELEPQQSVDDPPCWRREPERGPARLVAEAVADRAGLGAGLLSAGVDLARHPARTVARILDDAKAVGTFASASRLAPRSALNDTVGHRRRLVAIRRDLRAVKAHAHAQGGTVNDLVLGAATSGLRQWMIGRDELPDDPSFALRALVPVSLHTAAHELGNEVSAIVVDLPVGLDDPTDRFRSITAGLARHKASGEALASRRLLRGADLLPPPVARAVSRAVHHQPFVNLVITNVPGTSFPLYAMGAKLLDAVPIVPLAGNLALSIGVLSYDGNLDLGLFADPDLLPDLDELVSGMEAGFDAYGVDG